MKLNLPIVDQVANCKNLLIAGMGGGFDLFCGLPIYFELIKNGKNVHLANYSFSDIANHSGGKRLTETLVGVDSEFEKFTTYFPELYLAKWFKEKQNESTIVWSFHKTGTGPLLTNYKILVDHLKIDGILLIDGGVDSLVRGDEVEMATLVEDAISLYAVNELIDIPVKIIGCIGFGAERNLSYTQILENISDLIMKEAFFGNCSLTNQMESYKKYEEAVLFVQDQEFQDPSVINSSIISSVQGRFGDYHLTTKTKGSVLKISPLMSQYWFFNLSSVAKNNYYLSQIEGTKTFMDTVHAVMELTNKINTRKNIHTFKL